MEKNEYFNSFIRIRLSFLNIILLINLNKSIILILIRQKLAKEIKFEQLNDDYK